MAQKLRVIVAVTECDPCSRVEQQLITTSCRGSSDLASLLGSAPQGMYKHVREMTGNHRGQSTNLE